MVDHVVVLAGGTGTRLWPASLRSRPKQFMDPGNGRTLIENTLRRAVATGADGELLVVTHVDQVAVLGRYGSIDRLDKPPIIIAEPQAKNTAPAIALAISYLARGGNAQDQTVLVLASDHVIAPTDAFIEDVERADELARDGRLVTFGIPPTRPETGYGYILAGGKVGPGRVVSAFKEKPDAITAQRYLDDGGYLWNSGMFVFRIGTIADELQRLAPEVMEPIGKLDWPLGAPQTAGAGVPTTVGDAWAIAQIYLRLPNVSIDRAVMEKSECAAVVEAGFRWNDVGSWDEMAKLHEEQLLAESGDPESTAGRGKPATVMVEAEGNFVHSDLPVAICGVDDLCVVVKNGCVLVAKRGRTQLVRKAVDRLESGGHGDLV